MPKKRIDLVSKDATDTVEQTSCSQSAKKTKGGRRQGKPSRSNRYKGTSVQELRDDSGKATRNQVNDIGWYVKYPSIVTGSSSHIFNARLGHLYQPVTGLADKVSGHKYIGAKQAIPGVVSLLWTPWYSMKGDETDAVNIASKNLYTFIRHANSGSVNYESSDLMQYVLAVIELFAFAEQCKRDLKMIFTFKTTNIYLYKRVLDACGYSEQQVNDMITYYALYSNKLNILISQLNSFKIPKEMTVLARHCWLASHAWKDDELDKATTYVYNMQGFYHYRWAEGMLEFKQILSSLDTNIAFQARLDALEAEINNLLACEDIGIMLGDILKAYGNESCYFAAPLVQGETYEAEYSAEVVHQIRNATITGHSFIQRIKQLPSNSQLLYETQIDNDVNVTPVGLDSGTPTKLAMENGVYYFEADLNALEGSFGALNENWAYKPFLVIEANNPTNEEIILNTRLMSTIYATGYMSYDTDKVIAKLGECGTEVIVDCNIMTYESTYAVANKTYTDSFSMQKICTVTDSNASIDHITSTMYKIDNIPQHLIIHSSGTGTNINFFLSTYYYGKNVITVDEEWLSLLHKGCKLSEFTIPMFKLLESAK